MRAAPDLESELSGWRVLWQRIDPRARRTEVPTIMTLLARSSLVASIHSARERRAADGELYLRIPVADLRLLAFERIDEIAARGTSRRARRSAHGGRSGVRVEGQPGTGHTAQSLVRNAAGALRA